MPFALHSTLTASPEFDADAFAISSFRAAGHEFHWVDAVQSADAWTRVALDGHVLASTRARRDLVRQAILELAADPRVVEFVRRFVTTFVPVEADHANGDVTQLTSCSLPDFPLAVFISDHAQRHIPPLTVSPEPSPVLLAENIYHEAVHQYVNYRLLVDDFFPADYDARTATRVTIPWRRDATGRSSAWQLDRVLHAATVYVQLIRWRMDRLQSSGLSDLDRRALLDASATALRSCTFLVAALSQHIGSFTPPGAMFVGRLSLAAEEQYDRARTVLGGAGMLGAT